MEKKDEAFIYFEQSFALSGSDIVESQIVKVLPRRLIDNDSDQVRKGC